ncbi:hypothetical protein AMECASPLE_028768 [Ameca splendens]|uniref:Uncharacterized protein n=1 Tax=Ameca splendens TaxID=208324 RepID=A0ABV0Y636_9TELE
MEASDSNNDHGSETLVCVAQSMPDIERRQLLAPENQLQVPSQRHRSSSLREESPEEQLKFFSMITHGQRGRIEDQRCNLDPSRDPDLLLKLLTQSGRLDDQRVSFSSLPVLKNKDGDSYGDSSYFFNLVSKVQVSFFSLSVVFFTTLIKIYKKKNRLMLPVFGRNIRKHV